MAYKALNQRRIKYGEIFRVDDHNFLLYTQVAAELQFSMTGVDNVDDIAGLDGWQRIDPLDAGFTPIINCPVHALYRIVTSESYVPQSRVNVITTTDEYGVIHEDYPPQPGDPDYHDEVLICQ